MLGAHKDSNFTGSQNMTTRPSFVSQLRGKGLPGGKSDRLGPLLHPQNRKNNTTMSYSPNTPINQKSQKIEVMKTQPSEPTHRNVTQYESNPLQKNIFNKRENVLDYENNQFSQCITPKKSTSYSPLQYRIEDGMKRQELSNKKMNRNSHNSQNQQSQKFYQNNFHDTHQYQEQYDPIHMQGTTTVINSPAQIFASTNTPTNQNFGNTTPVTQFVAVKTIRVDNSAPKLQINRVKNLSLQHSPRLQSPPNFNDTLPSGYHLHHQTNYYAANENPGNYVSNKTTTNVQSEQNINVHSERQNTSSTLHKYYNGYNLNSSIKKENNNGIRLNKTEVDIKIQNQSHNNSFGINQKVRNDINFYSSSLNKNSKIKTNLQTIVNHQHNNVHEPKQLTTPRIKMDGHMYNTTVETKNIYDKEVKKFNENVVKVVPGQSNNTTNTQELSKDTTAVTYKSFFTNSIQKTPYKESDQKPDNANNKVINDKKITSNPSIAIPPKISQAEKSVQTDFISSKFDAVAINSNMEGQIKIFQTDKENLQEEIIAQKCTIRIKDKRISELDSIFEDFDKEKKQIIKDHQSVVLEILKQRDSSEEHLNGVFMVLKAKEDTIARLERDLINNQVNISTLEGKLSELSSIQMGDYDSLKKDCDGLIEKQIQNDKKADILEKLNQDLETQNRTLKIEKEELLTMNADLEKAKELLSSELQAKNETLKICSRKSRKLQNQIPNPCDPCFDTCDIIDSSPNPKPFQDRNISPDKQPTLEEEDFKEVVEIALRNNEASTNYGYQDSYHSQMSFAGKGSKNKFTHSNSIETPKIGNLNKDSVDKFSFQPLTDRTDKGSIPIAGSTNHDDIQEDENEYVDNDIFYFLDNPNAIQDSNVVMDESTNRFQMIGNKNNLTDSKPMTTIWEESRSKYDEGKVTDESERGHAQNNRYANSPNHVRFSIPMKEGVHSSSDGRSSERTDKTQQRKTISRRTEARKSTNEIGGRPSKSLRGQFIESTLPEGLVNLNILNRMELEKECEFYYAKAEDLAHELLTLSRENVMLRKKLNGYTRGLNMLAAENDKASSKIDANKDSHAQQQNIDINNSRSKSVGAQFFDNTSGTKPFDIGSNDKTNSHRRSQDMSKNQQLISDFNLGDPSERISIGCDLFANSFRYSEVNNTPPPHSNIPKWENSKISEGMKKNGNDGELSPVSAELVRSDQKVDCDNNEFERNKVMQNENKTAKKCNYKIPSELIIREESQCFEDSSFRWSDVNHFGKNDLNTFNWDDNENSSEQKDYITNMEKRVKKLESCLIEAERSFRDKKGDLLNMNEAYTNLVDNSEAELNKKNDKIEELKSDILKLEHENIKLKQELKELDDTKKEIYDENMEITEGFISQINQLESELEKAQKELEITKSKLGNSETSNEITKNELESTKVNQDLSKTQFDLENSKQKSEINHLNQDVQQSFYENNVRIDDMGEENKRLTKILDELNIKIEWYDKQQIKTSSKLKRKKLLKYLKNIEKPVYDYIDGLKIEFAIVKDAVESKAQGEKNYDDKRQASQKAVDEENLMAEQTAEKELEIHQDDCDLFGIGHNGLNHQIGFYVEDVL